MKKILKYIINIWLVCLFILCPLGIAIFGLTNKIDIARILSKIFIPSAILLFILAILHSFFEIKTINKFCCYFLEWHKPNEHIKQYGINSMSHCKYCNKSIMQMSDGSWFTSENEG